MSSFDLTNYVVHVALVKVTELPGCPISMLNIVLPGIMSLGEPLRKTTNINCLKSSKRDAN